MLNKHLLKIASLVPKDKVVLDVGTDHAYLPIYLIKNNICSKVIASDISKNALLSAENNLKKYHVKNIKLVLSDGLENIKDNYDLLIISGMGTSTIMHILDYPDLPSQMILSSNNDLYLLRKYMNKKGYAIKEEVVVEDRKKFYDIIYYDRLPEKLNYKELKFGKSNNKEYYNYLYEQSKKIYYKVNFFQKIKMIKDLLILKRLLKK